MIFYEVEDTVCLDKDDDFEVIIDKKIIIKHIDNIQTIREYYDKNNKPLKEYKEYEREI